MIRIFSQFIETGLSLKRDHSKWQNTQSTKAGCIQDFITEKKKKKKKDMTKKMATPQKTWFLNLIISF